MPLSLSCIGSSRGWLFFYGNSGNIFIFNVTFRLKIFLPPMSSFQVSDGYREKVLSRCWMRKIILWGGDPILENDYGVAVIYGSLYTRLAFFKNGDSNWKKFEGSDKNYSDIIYHDGFIFVLTDSWCIEIKPSIPNNMRELEDVSLRNLYSSRRYLVESKGDLLSVVRCIGDAVYIDGKVISLEDLNEAPYNLFPCPYETMNFYIYKLNMQKTVWEEMNNLDDQMLFIGGNHSFSLSAKNYVGFNKSSIYFTDDNWDETLFDDHDNFLGHDSGIFNLKNGLIEYVYVYDSSQILASFWIKE